MIVDELHIGVMHMIDSVVVESRKGSVNGTVADANIRSEGSREGSVELLLSPDCGRFMLVL